MGICVFWYPVIYHSPLNERFRRFEIEQCVSDFGYPEAYLKISIAHSETSIEETQKKRDLITRPITVECYKKESNGKKTPVFTTFTLEYKNHSRNGMVVYEYDEPKDYPKDEQARPFEEFLTGVCYHHVKSLFHNHEVQSDRDSGLMAYLPEGKFDINSIREVNNGALSYYIKQYERIFLQYAEKISKRLQDHDGIDRKFKNQIGLQNDNGGFPGYEGLVKYGLCDFRRWFSGHEHQDEVETLKKDILKWSLLLNPHKNKISRNLSSYEKRIINILNNINNRIENSDEKYYYLDLLNRTQTITQTVTKFVGIRKELPNYKLYRYELEPINTILNEIEIELGIYKRQYFCQLYLYVYWQLDKLILNKHCLTKDHREKINKFCEGASTEYVYCKTLLESRYNWRIKKDNYTEAEYDDRRTALNIRNSIRYIETAKYRHSTSQTNDTHSILKKAERVSRFAFFVSILGVIITIYKFDSLD